MQLELQSACNFIVHLIRLKRQNICESQLLKFYNNLLEVLIRRYRDNWFPDKPYKGSGYRCIRLNSYAIDPIIIQAGESSDLSKEFLTKNLPNNFMMWINPLDVSYRFEEHGCIYNLFDNKCYEAWKHKLHVDKKIKNNQVAPAKTVNISDSKYPIIYPYNSLIKSYSIELLKSYIEM
jgi:protein Tob/BTG